jgi:hypothetical protein
MDLLKEPFLLIIEEPFSEKFKKDISRAEWEMAHGLLIYKQDRFCGIPGTRKISIQQIPQAYLP